MENNWKWKLISNFIGINRYYNESTIESDRLIGSTRRFPKGNKGLKIYGERRSNLINCFIIKIVYYSYYGEFPSRPEVLSLRVLFNLLEITSFIW